ncbi:unnamed protein product [Closterium sp. NIES-53]
MDVWGPARVSGHSRERYFLLVVDDYTHHGLPLAQQGQDLPVLRLHSDIGGEFSSTLLRDFCRGEGILQSFLFPDSPQQNGIAERRIGLVMEPRVSLPETSPTLRWTGEVGNASVFRVWGSCAFVHDTSADKLSHRAIPCVFVGFVPDVLGWQFYHPTSRRVFPPQDVTFDESVPFYRLFPYRSAPPPAPPLFLAPAVDSCATRGAASGGAEPGGAESEGAETGGAEPGGVATRGAEPGGVATGCAEPAGVEPGGAESEGAESGGAEPQGAASSGGGTATTGPGGARTRGTGASGTGGVEGAGAGVLTESSTTGAGGAGAGGAGVGGPFVGGARAGGARAVDLGGTVRPRPYFIPPLQQVLGTPPSAALPPPLLCPPPDQSQPPLQPASPLPAPSPYTEQSGSLTEHREPVSRPVSPVRTARRVPHSRPPPVPCTHAMTLRPSSIPLCVPLPAPLESSLPEVPDLESDCARAASPTVSRLLATAVTDPSFESATASALVAEQLEFAAACRLDYPTSLVAEFVSASPPSFGCECALGTDVLEDRQENFECLAAVVPRFASMLLAPEGDPDAPDIPTPCSYAEAIMGPYSSQWVKRPPGSPPAFKARYVARGFSQRQGVDYFHTFSPTPKMTTLRVLLHVAAQPDNKLHAMDFSTAFLQANLHEEICLRRPVYGLRQAPCEWHDTLRTTLATLGFAPATADPSLFLRSDNSLPPFYVLVYVLQRFGFQFSSPQPTPLSTSHSLSAPPSDKSVEPSGPYPELVGCLIYLMTCTRPDLAYPLSLLARYVAPGKHRKGYTFSLGSGSVSWRSTRSSSVLSSSCEAEIYPTAMAAQELRRLTYLLTDLGEQPRSPPRGQLCLAYVATRANTTDVFTKALPPGDHQHFVTVLGLLALLFLTGLVTTCSPPLCL